jgi:hypothetical protein
MLKIFFQATEFNEKAMAYVLNTFVDLPMKYYRIRTCVDLCLTPHPVQEFNRSLMTTGILLCAHF